MNDGPQLENGYGRIANELVEALAKHKIPGNQMQCFWVIFRHTYCWGLKKGEISLSVFVEMTGLKKSHISRALKDLLSKMVITVTKNGNKSHSTYGINKHYLQWNQDKQPESPLPKMVTTVTKNGNKPTSIPITSKETIKEITPLPPKKKKAKIEKLKIDYSVFSIELPYWLNLELWDLYKQERKKMKKPLGDNAEKLAIGKLGRMVANGFDPDEIIENSVTGGWQGLFEPKQNSAGGQRGPKTGSWQTDNNLKAVDMFLNRDRKETQ